MTKTRRYRCCHFIRVVRVYASERWIKSVKNAAKPHGDPDIADRDVGYDDVAGSAVSA